MEQFTINNIIYDFGDDIIKDYKECKTSRDLIKFFKLKDEDYIFLKLNKKELIHNQKWIESTQKYARAKIFIKTNIIEKLKNTKIIKVIKETDKNLKKINNDINEIRENYKKNNEEIKDAPLILNLKDEDKFRDINNNIIEIEIRGKQECDDIYFKMKNISDGFNLGNTNILFHKNTSFKRNEHYITFYIQKNTCGNTTSSKTKKNFLTYYGLVKLLFVSRSKNAQLFQKWAINKLFTIQFGKDIAKCELIKEIGINIPDMKKYLKISASEINCLYLIKLGYVKDLRSSLKINDNIKDEYLICKYGRTNDLSRRIIEHTNHYKKKIISINLWNDR
jgi:hypothetical protein